MRGSTGPSETRLDSTPVVTSSKTIGLTLPTAYIVPKFAGLGDIDQALDDSTRSSLGHLIANPPPRWSLDSEPERPCTGRQNLDRDQCISGCVRNHGLGQIPLAAINEGVSHTGEGPGQPSAMEDPKED